MDWEAAIFSASHNPSAVGRDWIVLPSTVRDFYTDPTLMATLFTVTWTPTTGFIQLLPDAFFAFGIIEWDSKDDNIPPVAGTPLPLDDANLDWIARWVRPIPQGENLDATASSTFQVDGPLRSKARRRLGSDGGILWVSQSKVITDFSAFAGEARCLIKE